MSLTKEVLIRAAYDKRDPDPSKNYGIHGVELSFILKGEEGAIQFVIYTNWMLPQVQKEQDLRRTDHIFCHPVPADIAFHSPKPMYEGHEPMGEKCSVINGDCYCDGSALAAENVFKIMVEGGGDAMWKDMLTRYNEMFKTAQVMS